jgi:hypothetical protein
VTVPPLAGVYADCAMAADLVSGFPQSLQYLAIASFSWPQKPQVVFKAAFGDEDDGGGEELDIVTQGSPETTQDARGSRGGKTAWAANIGREK